MSSEYEEQIALQGMMIGRPESPALEGAASKAIEAALRDLIERRYLYQKIGVDFSGVGPKVSAAVDEAIKRAIVPPAGGGGGPVQIPAKMTPERLKLLLREVETRPWRLVTRHTGDGKVGAEIRKYARMGSQPLGTPPEQLDLRFYLPAIQLWCPGRCKGTSTFIALSSSTDGGFDSPFPRTGTTGTEQVYVPIYRCEMCRETIYTMLVRRTGIKLHLCGYAPRREPLVVKSLPQHLSIILSDAEQAVAEGDVFAAFYHLRTLEEHYLKTRLGIPIEEQVRGEDLVSRHYKSISKDLGSVLPSLTTAWEKLSQWLHTRTGDSGDYQGQRDSVCKHIEVLSLLEAKPGGQIEGQS